MVGFDDCVFDVFVVWLCYGFFVDGVVDSVDYLFDYVCFWFWYGVGWFWFVVWYFGVDCGWGWVDNVVGGDEFVYY